MLEADNNKAHSLITKHNQRFIIDKLTVKKLIDDDDLVNKLFITHNHQDEQEIIEYISQILTATISYFKSFPTTIDEIHRKILDLSPNFNLKIRICCCFLQKFEDVRFDTLKEINGLTLTNYYHKIIDEILQLNELSATAYNCLAEIAKFNPLIIESKLQKIFEKILIATKETQEIENSYNVLLLVILDACGRLRRENKLVGWILGALNRSLKDNEKLAEINTMDIFPKAFTDKFTGSIRNMSIVLSDVLASFIYHFDVIATEIITTGEHCKYFFN